MGWAEALGQVVGGIAGAYITKRANRVRKRDLVASYGPTFSEPLSTGIPLGYGYGGGAANTGITGYGGGPMPGSPFFAPGGALISGAGQFIGGALGGLGGILSRPAAQGVLGATAASGVMSYFGGGGGTELYTPSGNARALVMGQTPKGNPVFWRYAGRPILFSGDLRTLRQARRVASRFGRFSGKR